MKYQKKCGRFLTNQNLLYKKKLWRILSLVDCPQLTVFMLLFLLLLLTSYSVHVDIFQWVLKNKFQRKNAKFYKRHF